MINTNSYSYYRGKIEKTVSNIYTFLTNDPEYVGKFKYNLFTDEIEYDGKSITKDVITHIANDVKRELGFYDPILVGRTLYDIADEKVNSYHPVKDFLNSLTWDGKSRVETMTTSWFNSDETSLSKAINRTFLKMAIKRIMEPGCRIEYSLLLNGVRKSDLHTFCERLSAGLGLAVNVDTKETRKYAPILNRSWICLMDELIGHDYKQQDRIKDVVRRSKDIFIPPYKTYHVTNQRHCVFIGSTSNEEFLKENSIEPCVKYWIINCGHIDKDYICNNFDDETVKQLWAEAYYMYKKNPDIYSDFYEVQELILNQNNNK